MEVIMNGSVCDLCCDLVRMRMRLVAVCVCAEEFSAPDAPDASDTTRAIFIDLRHQIILTSFITTTIGLKAVIN